MGIFDVFRRPANTLPGSNYINLGTRSNAGKTVNAKTAMQYTAVYSCVRILAEAFASLPAHLYRYTDKGSAEKAIDHILYRLIHDEPNPEMTSYVFRETAMTHLLLWGNFYAQKIYNGKGEVMALYPLMPDRMKVDRDKVTKQIYYEYTVSEDEANLYSGQTIRLDRDQVLHIPGMGYNGLVGFSPISMARNAIGMGIAAEEYGSMFYINNATPGGVLEHPGIVKDPAKLREQWQSNFGGANMRKVAVLEEGMKYNPISISPSDAQFLETRKFQVNEICRIYKVPPHMVADLDKSSFSNIEQQSLEFVEYTLDPWVCRWEQALKKELLSEKEKDNYFVKFNVDGLLRGDYASRMQGYATARQNGWMSANDIRALENMNLIPDDKGGNMYLVNGNFLPMEKAGAYAEKAMREE